MASRFMFYVATGVRDACRARGPLLLSVLIVVGICLVINLKSGIRRGLVDQFRSDIEKSPSARIIEVWRTPATTGEPFTVSEQLTLKGIASHQLPLVIPDISTVVELTGESGFRQVTTVLSSCRDDPLLASLGTRLPGDGRSVVLSQGVAEAYAASVQTLAGASPARLRLIVRRPADDQLGELAVKVAGVVSANDAAATAYADVQLLDWLDRFKRGLGVPELGWPALAGQGPPVYEGYLAFCPRPYTAQDRQRLQLRGLTPTLLDATDERVRLCGLLRVHSLPVYYLSAQLKTPDDQTRVALDARELEQITVTDDVVLPWTSPVTLMVGGELSRIVGVTLRGRWLQPYFRHYGTRRLADDESLLRSVFSTDDRLSQTDCVPVANTRGETLELASQELPEAARLRASVIEPHLTNVSRWFKQWNVVLDWDLPFDLPQELGWPCEGINPSRLVRAIDRAVCAPPDLPLVVASAAQASRLARWVTGDLVYDPAGAQLVPQAKPSYYQRARVYAATIDDVPDVDQALQAAGYATLSSRSRVLEMQSYVRMLHQLDLVVGLGLVLFAGVAITLVFWEVTRRKRGDIGVLRLLGVSGPGVFVILLMRAVVVWLAAGLLTWPLAVLMAFSLTAGGVSCRLQLTDVAVVETAALVLCMVAVGWPALYASIRLQPADAIDQGRLC